MKPQLLLVKARPGLTLETRTDKHGRSVKRWVKQGGESAGRAANAKPQAPAEPVNIKETARKRLDELAEYKKNNEVEDPRALSIYLYSLHSSLEKGMPLPSVPKEMQKKSGGSDKDKQRLDRAKAQGFDTSTVWYHGTAGDFDEFDDARQGSVSSGVGEGIWLTTTHRYAAEYANNAEAKGDGKDKANVLSLYVRPGKTLKVEFPDGPDEPPTVDGKAMDWDDNAAVIKYAKQKGYDSIHWVDGSFTDEPAMTIFNAKDVRRTDAKFDDKHRDGASLRKSLYVIRARPLGGRHA